MTDKEAIEIIKVAIAEVEWEYPMEYVVAFDRAIEALKKCDNLKKIIDSCTEQIRWERDIAVAQLKELGYGLGEKPKTGHWITLENISDLGNRVKCSECGQVFVVGDDVSRKYCPNCGSKMDEEVEE